MAELSLLGRAALLSEPHARAGVRHLARARQNGPLTSGLAPAASALALCCARVQAPSGGLWTVRDAAETLSDQDVAVVGDRLKLTSGPSVTGGPAAALTAVADAAKRLVDDEESELVVAAAPRSVTSMTPVPGRPIPA